MTRHVVLLRMQRPALLCTVEDAVVRLPPPQQGPAAPRALAEIAHVNVIGISGHRA